MNNVYEENNCLDLRAEVNDLRDRFYQFKAARSTPTHSSYTYTPHKSCSYCSNPYHCSSNCPSWGQLSNFSYGQMNTSFSYLGCDSNSNFYNPNWNNQSDFSWPAQTIGNYAPQFQELHHSDYPQFDHQAQPPAYQAPQPAPQSSLEEMMKAFMQLTDKNLQALTQSNDKLMNATMSNTRDIQELKGSVARIEGQIGHLVIELNRIEEEELQSQLMIERHHMSDEDDSKNSYHEHAQVTTTLNEDEIVDNKEEHTKQVEQIERVEHHEKSQPPANPNLHNDMEVSTKAPACITVPLETHQEPKVPSLDCLQEPSYAKILKDLCKQMQKSRNHFPKKILRSKQFYIRWRNILPEGYKVLKKKGWKGLIGHQYDRGKRCKVFSSSLFSALHSTFSCFPFSLIVFSFVFVSNSN
jgi:hypothetical protein